MDYHGYWILFMLTSVRWGKLIPTLEDNFN